MQGRLCTYFGFTFDSLQGLTSEDQYSIVST